MRLRDAGEIPDADRAGPADALGSSGDRARRGNRRSYSLHIDATDGVLGVRTLSSVPALAPSSYGSMVEQGPTTTQSDARDSASLSRDYTLATTALGEGEHTIDVIATDGPATPQ